MKDVKCFLYFWLFFFLLFTYFYLFFFFFLSQDKENLSRNERDQSPEYGVMDELLPHEIAKDQSSPYLCPTPDAGISSVVIPSAQEPFSIPLPSEQGQSLSTNAHEIHAKPPTLLPPQVIETESSVLRETCDSTQAFQGFSTLQGNVSILKSDNDPDIKDQEMGEPPVENLDKIADKDEEVVEEINTGENFFIYVR